MSEFILIVSIYSLVNKWQLRLYITWVAMATSPSDVIELIESHNVAD